MARYEEQLTNKCAFPVDAFIQDTDKSSVRVDEHWHECFEILYMLSGEAVQKINQRTFTARQGDLIMVKSGDIHSTFCDSGVRTRILVVKFMPSVIDIRYSKLDGSKYIAAFLNKELKDINELGAEPQKKIQNILACIFEEYTSKPKAYDLRIKGYIFELITILVRNDIITVPEQTVRDYDLKRMTSVLEYIEKNYSSKLTLHDISGILHMNYAYVSKYFKRVTGKTYKSYLDYVRICEADKQLMEKSDYIYRIAENCGFSSVNAFNRVYKRMKGYAPSELKR